MIVLRLIRESFNFAFHELNAHKTRTALTLLGITIGIFSVIMVFTIFDSMEQKMRKGIDSLGNNVIFVDKWQWQMGGDYPWWKYYQRPEISMNDLKQIEKRSTTAEAATFMTGTSRTVKYRGNSIEGVRIMAVSHDFDRVLPFDLGAGRYFSLLESSAGRPVVVVGHEIASNLFGDEDPIGKKIKIFGRKIEVIGIMAKEGEDMFGSSSDNQVLIPVNFARTVLDMRDRGAQIAIKAKPLVSNEELKDEMIGILRSVRKLKPSAEDNFSINELDIINRGFDQLFSVIAVVGWIIGGFSLLVGGFGIANIMFVSVRERINIIGIQKSLGAKNYFILLQFLFEAVFLAIFGGIIGLIIIFLITLVVTYAFDYEMILTRGNITIGIMVSASIGLVSGFIPALSASRMNPVDAMRANA